MGSSFKDNDLSLLSPDTVTHTLRPSPLDLVRVHLFSMTSLNRVEARFGIDKIIS